MEYQKVQSVAKQVDVKGPKLERTILETMKTISSVVGGTLGPGGQPVLIERFEHGMPALVTKDGVTVFRALGFEDPAAHCVMEAARDASIRTASEAGDGTTTATILSEAIVRKISEYTKANPRVSPQRVVRALERTLRDEIVPYLTKTLSKKVQLDTDAGKKLLKAVATVSANGDTDLADAVMRCFEITGDEGNVTITEQSGQSGYDVEKIEGYPVDMGYESSCAKFYPAFINDVGTQRVLMEKPVFVLYHGRLSEMQTAQILLEKIGAAWGSGEYEHHNVVICAVGFSESVLGHLSLNMGLKDTINVFPLVVPRTPQLNGQLAFLQDLQAVTGAKVFDPITAPLERAEIEDLGPGVSMFECYRFRSSVIGYADPELLMMRIDELKQQLKSPESEMDELWLNHRKAKLSNGIAKLRVIGSSNGELKEKRDRAEDAVCAVRGAIKHGCLPGGGWALLKVMSTIPRNDVNDKILRPALFAPFERLVLNGGIVEPTEAKSILDPILEGIAADKPVVYDFLNQIHVDPYEGGILDSTPAVVEAVRNSISIAALLGTLGGTVVFRRDHELERSEARNTAQYMRDSNVSEADERP